VTTRGFSAEDCRTVADYIVDAIESPDDEDLKASIAGQVREMMRQYPLPGIN
jgi:glycine hydroxymethyltransferase